MRCILVLMTAAAALPGAPARGELTPETVAGIRRAAALIELPPDRRVVLAGQSVVMAGRAFAPAFCVDESGLFVAIDQVADLARDGIVPLVINPSRPDQQVHNARVVSCDSTLGVAVLKVDGVQKLVALDITSVDPVAEKTKLFAVEFPTGLPTEPDRSQFPSIRVLTLDVHGLEKTPEGQDRLRLHGNIHGGHAGGAALDENTGKMIAWIQPRRINRGGFVGIPVKYLHALLQKPMIVFTPPALTLDQALREQQFRAEVLSILRPRADYSVEAEFVTGAQRRKFPAKALGDGSYAFTAIPMAQAGTAVRLRLAVKFPSGAVTCEAPDVSIKLNGADTLLSQIMRIDLGDKPQVLLATGERVPFTPALGPIPVNLNGETTSLDLSKAVSIAVESPGAPERSVRCIISVNAGGKPIAGLERVLPLVRSPATRDSNDAAAGPLALRDAALEGDSVMRELPGPVDDVFAGACGRLLFFRIGKLRQLAVLDVSEARIVKTIPLPADNAAAAANAEKLIIIEPDQRVVQRWDLKTLEREGSTILPAMESPCALSAGYASDGPMLLVTDKSIQFLNPQSSKLVDLHVADSAVSWLRHTALGGRRISVQASADGTAFVGDSNVTRCVLKLRRDTAEGVALPPSYYESHLFPNHDGTLFLTWSGILPLADLRDRAPGQVPGVRFVPTYHPDYALGLTYKKLPGNPPPTLTIYAINGSRPLVELSALDEFAQASRTAHLPGRLALEKLIHFIPQANVVITLGESCDKLFLRRCSIPELLEKAGRDSLVVTSVPPFIARRGTTWTYSPQFRSRKGGVTVSLDSGPDGMTLSRTNELHWGVPQSILEDSVNVILTARDASGQEIHHSFRLAIR